MSYLDDLRAQKEQGEREWLEKQAAEQKKRDDEAARVRAEEESRLAAEAATNRKRAEQVYAGLPALVRAASALGLAAAVLDDSFVEDRQTPMSKPIQVNRRTFYLTGWQIPFHALCEEAGIPITVVSERVDVGIKSVLQRSFHVLAVDLKRL